MAQPAAPQNKLGEMICCPGPCPPTSDLGLGAWQLGPIFFVVLAVSLVAGLKVSSNNRVLPLLTIAAAGAIFFQNYAFRFELERYAYVSSQQHKSIAHRFYESGRMATYERVVGEMRARHRRIAITGWLTYSILPFWIGVGTGAIRARRRPDGA